MWQLSLGHHINVPVPFSLYCNSAPHFGHKTVLEGLNSFLSVTSSISLSEISGFKKNAPRFL